MNPKRIKTTNLIDAELTVSLAITLMGELYSLVRRADDSYGKATGVEGTGAGVMKSLAEARDGLIQWSWNVNDARTTLDIEDRYDIEELGALESSEPEPDDSGNLKVQWKYHGQAERGLLSRSDDKWTLCKADGTPYQEGGKS